MNEGLTLYRKIDNSSTKTHHTRIILFTSISHRLQITCPFLTIEYYITHSYNPQYWPTIKSLVPTEMTHTLFISGVSLCKFKKRALRGIYRVGDNTVGLFTTEHRVLLNRVRRSPVESGGLILVYMYIKWCIPVVLVFFFLYISYNFQQNKY
jgi:hypothetical protein